MGYNAGLVQKNGTEIYVIKWKNIKICRNKKRSKPVKARSVMYKILRCLAFLEFLSHINFPNIAGKKHSVSIISPIFSILEKSYKTNLSSIGQKSVI